MSDAFTYWPSHSRQCSSELMTQSVATTGVNVIVGMLLKSSTGHLGI